MEVVETVKKCKCGCGNISNRYVLGYTYSCYCRLRKSNAGIITNCLDCGKEIKKTDFIKKRPKYCTECRVKSDRNKGFIQNRENYRYKKFGLTFEECKNIFIKSEKWVV